MSNLTQNRVNGVLVDTDLTALTTALNTFISKLPPNTALSDAERAAYNAIDVSNKVFCDDVLTEAKATGIGIIRTYLSTASLENDLKLYTQIDALMPVVTNLLQRITDLKRISGHEAFVVSNAMYRDYREGADAGIPNAKAGYDRLKTRYQAQTPVGRPIEEQ